MVVVHNRTEETFREVIEKHIAPGTTIWTDGHASYKWLGTDPRFDNNVVVHSRGEFKKVLANGVVVSTNAIEGVFGRCKRLLRHYNAVTKKKEADGLYLGELMWRTMFLSTKRVKAAREWRRRAFGELLKAISAVYHPASTGELYEPEDDNRDWWQCLQNRDRVKCARCKRGGKRRRVEVEAEAAPPSPGPLPLPRSRPDSQSASLAFTVSNCPPRCCTRISSFIGA